MSAVLTPPEEAPAGADTANAQAAAAPPLHAVEPGEAPPVAPRPRSGAAAIPPKRSSSNRKYAILAALAAVLCLGALVAHKLRQIDASGLKDPVTPRSGAMLNPVADHAVSLRPSQQDTPPTAATQASAPELPGQSASASVQSIAGVGDAAPAPAASGGLRGPTQATSLPALAEVQAAQVGINANLTAGLAQLQHDLADLKAKVDGLAADQTARAQAAAPTRVARARPKPAAPPPAPAPTGAVLAVDLWDGQASVVVGTGVAADKRVLFLREGDTKNGVTVKAANPTAQSALFDVNGHETLLRADGRNE